MFWHLLGADDAPCSGKLHQIGMSGEELTVMSNLGNEKVMVCLIALHDIGKGITQNGSHALLRWIPWLL